MRSDPWTGPAEGEERPWDSPGSPPAGAHRRIPQTWRTLPDIGKAVAGLRQVGALLEQDAEVRHLPALPQGLLVEAGIHAKRTDPVQQFPGGGFLLDVRQGTELVEALDAAFDLFSSIRTYLRNESTAKTSTNPRVPFLFGRKAS